MTFTTFLIIWIACGVLSSILWLIHTARKMGKITVGDAFEMVPLWLLGCIGLIFVVGTMMEENVRYDAIIWKKKP